ncbi:unnamed protein product [Phaeothamnion confervicola]
MSGWDADRVTFSNQHLGRDNGGRDELAEGEVDRERVKKQFGHFVKTFQPRSFFNTNATHVYREQLLQRHRKRQPWLEVNLADVKRYSEDNNDLYELLRDRPVETLPLFEQGVRDALLDLVNARDRMQQDAAGPGAQDQDDMLPNLQVVLHSDEHPTSIRALTASHVNKLLKVPGIVISASRIRAKACFVRIQCKKCRAAKTVACAGAFGGAALPMNCDRNGVPAQEGEAADCGPDPFVIVPDECVYVDQQTLKLQARTLLAEAPEVVPTGEMPRNILISVDRTLVDKVSPGTRVEVVGISSLFQSESTKKQVGAGSAIRTPYLKAVGIEVTSEGAGRASASFTPAEEEQFLAMARQQNIYEAMAESIAPSISGDYTRDIKKALACQLFGGSRKALPDGTRLRGDINILLLGDPSTAKSQFLKFIEKVAPVGVYTSGKGSSAAGLTASVIKDKHGEYYLEGGAMVLADGGVVCIDEFDKMRETDRVAIHEAMEQQTISVAKAGITTILNSRTSVLAAANPIFGRYDDTRSAADNIDLMTTILSRFDLIFIVRDIRDEERDRSIARHVMSVHVNASGLDGGASEGEIDLATMKKFVSYCRLKCAPRLSDDAAQLLSSQYVTIREGMRHQAMEGGEEAMAVPITVRQLEALVRISESLAKMRLSPEVTVQDVAEAFRLFQQSTMEAAKTGVGGGDIASLGPGAQQEVLRAEDFLKRHIAVRSTVNARKLCELAVAQGHADPSVRRAIAVMVMRGEVQEKNRGFMLHRLK